MGVEVDFAAIDAPSSPARKSLPRRLSSRLFQARKGTASSRSPEPEDLAAAPQPKARPEGRRRVPRSYSAREGLAHVTTTGPPPAANVDRREYIGKSAGAGVVDHSNDFGAVKVEPTPMVQVHVAPVVPRTSSKKSLFGKAATADSDTPKSSDTPRKGRFSGRFFGSPTAVQSFDGDDADVGAPARAQGENPRATFRRGFSALQLMVCTDGGDESTSPRSVAQPPAVATPDSSASETKKSPLRVSARVLGILPTANRARLNDLYVVDHNSVLGSGTFAEVRAGYDRRTLEPVAIKTIDAVLGDREIRKAIDCEKKIAKVELVHRHIVQTHNIFPTLRQTHIVLDLMTGSLEEVMKYEQRLSETRARLVMYQLLQAMKYLRVKNVVHRDIKPDNMLFCVESSGSVCFKLSDFGLAEILTARKSGRMVATGTYGTPFFASPEVINDEEYDCAADVWSAGVMLYFLLSGKQPFDGPNPREVMRRARTGVVEFPDNDWHNRGISLEAMRLIRSMVRLRPDRRPTPDQALTHPWFGDPRDIEKSALVERFVTFNKGFVER